MVKNPPAMQVTWVQHLGLEDPLEESMAPTPLFLPGEPPLTEECGRLQSMGSQRVEHNGVIKHSTTQRVLLPYLSVICVIQMD